MDMTDEEFDQMFASVKRYAKRVARPLALATLAFILSASQAYFTYSSWLLAFVVFVLASSTYGARAAYAIVLFLTLLILIPPEAMSAFQRGMTSIGGKSL